MESNKNLPEVINHSKIALELIKTHKDAQDLIFVSEEDLRTQSMFLPEVVIIHSTPDDFHNISGKFMPKGHQTDKIGEAAGVEYLQTNCGTRTEQVDGNTAYVGFAQGRKRMPDGTWRMSSICEYEFNPEARAEEDILKNPNKYKDETSKKLKVLELKKFARQRASTGARLRVVRELTGMPIAFKPEQIKRSMVFCRVAVNTDLIFANPAMRDAAVKAALGITAEIYGPQKEERKALTEGITLIETNGDNGESTDQGPTWDAPPEETQETQKEILTREMMEDLRLRRKEYDAELPEDAKNRIDDILAMENPTMSKISGAIEKLDEWEEWKKGQGGGE